MSSLEGAANGTFWNSFLSCPQAALASSPRGQFSKMHQFPP
ncbi:hypothetical protein Hanom_Chr06g00577331 [Helianthus anomalus]